jgi:hypothetical protein
MPGRSWTPTATPFGSLPSNPRRRLKSRRRSGRAIAVNRTVADAQQSSPGGFGRRALRRQALGRRGFGRRGRRVALPNARRDAPRRKHLAVRGNARTARRRPSGECAGAAPSPGPLRGAVRLCVGGRLLRRNHFSAQGRELLRSRLDLAIACAAERTSPTSSETCPDRTKW